MGESSSRAYNRRSLLPDDCMYAVTVSRGLRQNVTVRCLLVVCQFSFESIVSRHERNK